MHVTQIYISINKIAAEFMLIPSKSRDRKCTPEITFRM